MKLESSNLACGYDIALLVLNWYTASSCTLKYNISERGRGLGHVNPRKFGIPLTIYRKAMKLESSNLVCGYDISLPTIWSYNISEKRRGLGNVTLEFLAYPQVYLQNQLS